MKKNVDPERMCCACRQKKPKSQLWRIVSGPEGARLDPTGKADGRGCYVCRQPDCIRKLRRRKTGLRQLAVSSLREICDELLRKAGEP